MLQARSDRRLGSVVRESNRLRDGGGDDGRLLVDRDDGLERVFLEEAKRSSGFRKSTVKSELGCRLSIVLACSETTVTSTPSLPAAAMKSGAR
jgi:hypothetical protein